MTDCTLSVDANTCVARKWSTSCCYYRSWPAPNTAGHTHKCAKTDRACQGVAQMGAFLRSTTSASQMNPIGAVPPGVGLLRLLFPSQPQPIVAPAPNLALLLHLHRQQQAAADLERLLHQQWLQTAANGPATLAQGTSTGHRVERRKLDEGEKNAQKANAFSIDGLLGAKGETGAEGRGGGVDYFMEEEELSWTDGRRNGASKRPGRAGRGAKHKQPQLPSLRSSTGAKYACSECGKSYATSSNLSRHKQTHRPLDSPLAKKCSFCDRKYVSMPALSMHLLVHEKRHKCHICGKLFSRLWLLNGHLRSHTGLKPFGCGNCGKAFSDKSNLRAHLNTHTNEKRWRCSQCGRGFALRSYLAKHVEQQHGGGPEEEGPNAERAGGTALLPSLEEIEQ